MSARVYGDVRDFDVGLRAGAIASAIQTVDVAFVLRASSPDGHPLQIARPDKRYVGSKQRMSEQ